MNDGNAIREIQNHESQLELLAAQRSLYAEAKVVDAVAAVICLGFPIAATLIQLGEKLPFPAIVGIELIVFVVGLLLPMRSKDLSEKAAGVQQKFDSILYGISFEDTLNNSRIVAEYSQKYLISKGFSSLAESDLVGWYEAPIENLPAKEAIPICQEENSSWTSRLLSRYLIAGTIAALVVLAALLVPATAKQVDLSSLTFIFSVAEWWGVLLFRGICTVYSAHRLAKDIPRYATKDLESIVRVQGYIYRYRSTALLVPEWFYDLFKSRDGKHARKLTPIEGK